MRDHSTRGYNKSKVTRYRTKSRYLANGPMEKARKKYSDQGLTPRHSSKKFQPKQVVI